MFRRLIFTALLPLVVAGLTRMVSRYEVEGRSMLQAFKPGDRLLVESLSYRHRLPRLGEVVVLRQPGSNGRRDLKRIAGNPGSTVTVRGIQVELEADQWFVLGDNLDESTDSRQLGPISRSDILGRLWFKY